MGMCSCWSRFSRSHKVAGMRKRPGCPGRFESPIPKPQSLPSSRKQRIHLLQRVRLDLADAFGGGAVLVGKVLQGDLFVVVQQAALDDVARTVVQPAPAFSPPPQMCGLAVNEFRIASYT